MTNMFKPTKATNIKEYLESLPEERKKPMLFLHNFIQKVSSKFKSHFAYNMLGYGSFPYKSALGKVSVGKSCIRFKKLEEVNLSELEKILQKAAKTPGLVIAVP